jgi:hypothetical protein
VGGNAAVLWQFTVCYGDVLVFVVVVGLSSLRRVCGYVGFELLSESPLEEFTRYVVVVRFVVIFFICK